MSLPILLKILIQLHQYTSKNQLFSDLKKNIFASFIKFSLRDFELF